MLKCSAIRGGAVCFSLISHIGNNRKQVPPWRRGQAEGRGMDPPRRGGICGAEEMYRVTGGAAAFAASILRLCRGPSPRACMGRGSLTLRFFAFVRITRKQVPPWRWKSFGRALRCSLSVQAMCESCRGLASQSHIGAYTAHQSAFLLSTGRFANEPGLGILCRMPTEDFQVWHT